MSKLEVREIGPISGETEVRLADGATAVGFGGGKLLQVVQGVYSTQIVTSSETYITSELKASITPSSTSSKILGFAKVTGLTNTGGGGDEVGGAIALFRNGSNKVEVGSQMYSFNNPIRVDGAINFLDSPSSTSSLNYEVYFKMQYGDSQFCHYGNSPSSIILMEVEG